MEKKGMPLNKKYFLLGTIAPDLLLTCYFIPHKYEKTEPFLYQITKKAATMNNYSPAISSFIHGVITHFICDYFCYPHSSVYNSGLRYHRIYEKHQRLNTGRSATAIDNTLASDCDSLSHQLEDHICEWESGLFQDPKLAEHDMDHAAGFAEWYISSLSSIAKDATNRAYPSMDMHRDFAFS